MLEPRHGAYALCAGAVTLALVVGWTAFALVGSSWWQLAVAAFLGVVFVQLGFLGHDAGHHQVMRGGRASTVIGLLAGNLAIGLGTGWWTDKHDRHHAHPNDAELDPDVAPGALVFHARQAGSRSGIGRFTTRWQAFLVLPMMVFEGLSLHVASLLSFRQQRGGRRWLELSLLIVHLVAYFGVLFWLLPVGQAVAFVAVNQGVFGLYLSLSFAPNHKGMPELSEVEAACHLRRQALTARNVRPGRLTDAALGGLNYQIEHHLFPRMPRANLRHAQPIVRAFCDSRGISYLETGLARSYALAFTHLHHVGAGLRPSARA